MPISAAPRISTLGLHRLTLKSIVSFDVGDAFGIDGWKRLALVTTAGKERALREVAERAHCGSSECSRSEKKERGQHVNEGNYGSERAKSRKWIELFLLGKEK